MKKDTKVDKMMQGLSECKTTCPRCQHRMGMLPMMEYAVCNYCGTKITNQSKARFKYMIWKLKGEKNEI